MYCVPHQGVKGLVLVKILDNGNCPVSIVKEIFDRVRRDALPCSRHVVRVVPLQVVCYPNLQELEESVRLVMEKSFGIMNTKTMSISEPEPESVPEPPVKKAKVQQEDAPSIDSGASESGEPSSPGMTNSCSASSASPVAVSSAASSSSVVPPGSFTVVFKRRNHNVLQRTDALNAVLPLMPKTLRPTYSNPEVNYDGADLAERMLAMPHDDDDDDDEDDVYEKLQSNYEDEAVETASAYHGAEI